MSKKKGVSADEKRSRMLELFYEKKEFFQLKELEKIAPKEKGIISGSVKDVIEQLVDEGLVDTEKIGTSIYFWAFPSKVLKARKRAYSELQSKLEADTNLLEQSKEEIKVLKLERQGSEDRDRILNELAELEVKHTQLRSEIEKYKDNDPEVEAMMQKEIVVSVK